MKKLSFYLTLKTQHLPTAQYWNFKNDKINSCQFCKYSFVDFLQKGQHSIVEWNIGLEYALLFSQFPLLVLCCFLSFFSFLCVLCFHGFLCFIWFLCFDFFFFSFLSFLCLLCCHCLYCFASEWSFLGFLQKRTFKSGTQYRSRIICSSLFSVFCFLSLLSFLSFCCLLWLLCFLFALFSDDCMTAKM